MTFASKQHADAYDKMLDVAELLAGLLVEHQLLDEAQADQVAMFLAQRKDEVVQLMQGKLKAGKKVAAADTDDSAEMQSAPDAGQGAAAGVLNLVSAA